MIRVGQFDDFKGYTALLFEVDSEGLRGLRCWVHAVIRGGAAQDLTQWEGVKIYRNLSVRAAVADSDVGLVEDSAGVLVWRRTKSGWLDVLGLLRGLKGCASGHQYLDAEVDKIVPIVCIGEYGERWWHEHAG